MKWGRSAGRTTPGGAPAQRITGRYTAPIPGNLKKSPKWMGILILVLAGVGMLSIILDYMNVLPGGASNWYLLTGLVCILSACLVGTRYR